MFQSSIKRDLVLWIVSLGFISLIVFAAFRANEFIDHWNSSVFKHPVIYNESSPYQNVVLTDNGEEFRLYLNSAIQFSSRDEYRYHEALVHVAGMQLEQVQNVVILGGGEGLALREVLKYSELDSVIVVELDPKIVEISSEFEKIKSLNENAFTDERVRVVNEDAFVWLMQNQMKYDLIIADLPDPTNESLSRLYSISFFHLVQNSLQENGVFVTQATSPELSPTAFRCIEETLLESGFTHTYPYSVNVPSFGNWGFVASTFRTMDFKVRPDISLKFIEAQSFDHIFYFPPDLKVGEVEANRLDRPVIIEYYLNHWNELQAEKR